MAVRMRRNVWKLPADDETLLWYARAVGQMQSRPVTDPTSWRYQAAIHEYIPDEDPLSIPGETLPSDADQLRFWSRCQHGTWFFLPWHRIYLGYFEQIVATAVKQLGGPDGWALPYWNYSDTNNANARRIPPAFRAATLVDGSPNPLFVAARDPRCNNGNTIAQPIDVDLSSCLIEARFTGQSSGGSPGFGGPRTGFEHSGGIIGVTEGIPHGSMHVAVGGLNPPGWMSSFNTAALDPLFWLHHANIDRLWVVWRRRNPQNVDPTLAQWLTGVKFEFHDAFGNVVTHPCRDVLDTTTTPPLNYRYEEENDPLAAVAPQPGPQIAGAIGMATEPVPEMVGATDIPVLLTNAPTRARMPIAAPTGPQIAAAGARPERMYVNVENITGDAVGQRYALYVNVPENQMSEDHPELLVGVLPMFGLKESSRSDAQHPGSGLHYTFEISRVADMLKARNDWNPQELRFLFVPYGLEPEAGQPAIAAAPVVTGTPIRVGRVSLYFA